MGKGSDKSSKERLDVLLVERGLFPTREKAKAAIMAGEVYIGEVKYDKAGTLVDIGSAFDIRQSRIAYVSRGGLKLEKAAREFGIELGGKICMDIGASTGGFTDYMLQNGALKVYAVDVGYGQLDYKLRNDKRVVNMEKTNIRYLDENAVKDAIDFISIDVSFISLALVLPVAERLLSEKGEIVSLIKPQFEAGRSEVGKKGIVRDKKVHMAVIERVRESAGEAGLGMQALTYSPIRGAKGNIEYLALFSRAEENKELSIEGVVETSHAVLEDK